MIRQGVQGGSSADLGAGRVQGQRPWVALRRGRNPLPTEALEKGEFKNSPVDCF